jgi:hypothetical protein
VPQAAVGRGRPPEAAARRAGLEFVEKLLTDSMVALLDGAEREHAPRVPPIPRPGRRAADGRSWAGAPGGPAPSRGVADHRLGPVGPVTI